MVRCADFLLAHSDFCSTQDIKIIGFGFTYEKYLTSGGIEMMRDSKRRLIFPSAEHSPPPIIQLQAIRMKDTVTVKETPNRLSESASVSDKRRSLTSLEMKGNRPRAERDDHRPQGEADHDKGHLNFHLVGRFKKPCLQIERHSCRINFCPVPLKRITRS
ncbi:hypothetical protein NPIL_477441 [Nephila pilipes]|uniref:Uncharacterized protein n=1 Tax=Nephila pilipes TaxID=299642 RepID=A0A8X6PXD9_NEPPI|nr:hypothetical protein NPIL_477441 [Nephila pilipes]